MKTASSKKLISATVEVENAKPTWPSGPTSNEFIMWSQKRGSSIHPGYLISGDRLFVCYDSGLLGCFNAKTGEMKEYQLPGNAYPHTIELDAKGNAWYTGNKNGTIGYLDPKSGQFKVYKMPDPNAKDPHSLHFDQGGILWFTLQQSNMMGRLDPRSGEIKLITSPTPRSRPYGVIVNSKGIPFVALFGVNKIAAIDPATMASRSSAASPAAP